MSAPSFEVDGAAAVGSGIGIIIVLVIEQLTGNGFDLGRCILHDLGDEIKADLLILRCRPKSLEEFEQRVRIIYEVYVMNLGGDVTY